MLNLTIDHLCVCVTRKCNMFCEHCMRGESQNIDMSNSIIDKILKDVSYIGSLTFSGGEPTLNISFMQQFFSYIKKRNITLGSFYIATNGKLESLELVKFLSEMLEYCEEKDLCALEVSKDIFHEEVLTPLYDLLKITRYRNIPSKYIPSGISNIIAEGRAEFSGYAVKEKEIDTWCVSFDEDDEIRVNNTLYIGCTGEVLSDCDISYENEKNFSIGNVLNNSLKDIVTEYYSREECCE